MAWLCRCLCCCCGGAAADDFDGMRDEHERRTAWTTKWKNALTIVRTATAGRPAKKRPRDVLFDALLHLYAHEDFEDAVRTLYDVYEVSPDVVRFYAPQLCNFLLHGGMPSAERLEVYLLDKCERSLHFAHRLQFFLTSYAPNVRYSSPLCGAVQRSGLLAAASPLACAVQVQGAMAASRMATEALSHDPSFQLMVAASASGASGVGVGDGGIGAQLLPTHASHLERAAGRALESESHADVTPTAHATHRSGAGGAGVGALHGGGVLSGGTGLTSLTPTVTPTSIHKLHPSDDSDASINSHGVQGVTSPMDRIRARLEQATIITADELQARRSMHAGESDAVALLPGSIGVAATAALVAVGAEVTTGSSSGTSGGPSGPSSIRQQIETAYNDTPSICSELTRISDQLLFVPQEERNSRLRLSLSAVNARFLPSATAYIPVGNVHHRLVAIHPEHSFCFKTKERVPYMAVMEVVDYANASGGELYESDSDDDDECRERARKLRAQLEAASGSPLGEGRGRSGTIGAGDAAAAAAAAMRIAAGRVTGAITVHAQAIGSYMLRQFNEVRHRGRRVRSVERSGTFSEGTAGGVGSSRVASRRVAGLVSPVRTPLGERRHSRRAGASAFSYSDTHPKAGVGSGAGVGSPTAGSVGMPTIDTQVTTSHREAASSLEVELPPVDQGMHDKGHSGAIFHSTRPRASTTHSEGSTPAGSHTHLLGGEERGHHPGARVARYGAAGGTVRETFAPAGAFTALQLSNSPGSLHKPLISREGSPTDIAGGSEAEFYPNGGGGVHPPALRSRMSRMSRDDDVLGQWGRHPVRRHPRITSVIAGGENAVGVAGAASPAESLFASYTPPPGEEPSALLLSVGSTDDAHAHILRQEFTGVRGDGTPRTPVYKVTTPASAPAALGTGHKPTFASPHQVDVATLSEDNRMFRRLSGGDGDDALVTDAELNRQLRELPDDVHAYNPDVDAFKESSVAGSIASDKPDTPNARRRYAQPPTSESTTAGPSDAVVILMNGSGDVGAGVSAGAGILVPGTVVRKAVDVEPKPVSVVFSEPWRDKEARVAATSLYSHLPGWRLLPIIIKSNDDLRQEQFAGQLLRQFSQIFHMAKVPVWMRPYDILSTHANGGLIEAIPDTISVDALKRGDPHFTTLDDWFERHFCFGSRGPERLAAAKMNYVRSMAAYSIVCYILAIKDRHNGNILIDRRGHVIHIDFGFLFTNSPGGNMNFEAAPFKLTQDYLQVLGGPRSHLFGIFRKLCIQAFLAARKYRERIIVLVEMMLSGNRDLKCFLGGPRAVMDGLRERFHEGLSDAGCVALVHGLIDQSVDNWRSRWYDAYQRWAQGVF